MTNLLPKRRRKGQSTWKSHERRTAQALGGHRVGNRGTATEDVEHEWLSIECKHRKDIPTWLVDAMRQAVINNAGGADKLPIVVLHKLGERSANDLVIMRMSDFREWFVGIAEQCEEIQQEMCEIR